MKPRLHIVYFGVLLLLLIGFVIVFPGSLYLVLPAVAIITAIMAKYRPTALSLWLAAGLTVLGGFAGHYLALVDVFWALVILWALVSLVDLLALVFSCAFKVERELPSRLAQGRPGEVKLKISNSSKFAYQINVFDGLPQDAKCEQMPWSGNVPAGNFTQIEYEVTVNERGITEFTETNIEATGKLRLWSKIVRIGEHQETKVYPNYEPVLQLSLLSMESSPEQLGIVKKNRSGLSKEFHQLRDYHEGDMLSQIDWKASSKRQSLISRSYHEQLDQNVILAIDCGRRMRAFDGEISQFDHCLNAMLLLAYVALKQGDNVGVMAYGGSNRWLPPVKGVDSMTTILNHLYDYNSSSSPSDYSEAVQRIMVKQKRRSMVVFMSNFRGEDASELLEPLRKLRQKHIVCLGNIREAEVNKTTGQEIHNLEDAIRVASTYKYLDSRDFIMKQLKSMNIPSVDATAQQLPVALANQYLSLREML